MQIQKFWNSKATPPKDLDYKVPCLLPIMEVEAETMMKGV